MFLKQYSQIGKRMKSHVSKDGPFLRAGGRKVLLDIIALVRSL